MAKNSCEDLRRKFCRDNISSLRF